MATARPIGRWRAGRRWRPGAGNLVLATRARRRRPRHACVAARNNPYAGRTLPGAVVATFLRGRPTVLDGKLQ
jgi:dihydroorotase